MAKMILQTYETDGPGRVIFRLDGRAPLFPTETVDVKTTADVLAALQKYAAEAVGCGHPVAVAIRLAKGERAPAGYRKLPQNQTLIFPEAQP